MREIADVRNRELFNGVANDRITQQIVDDIQKGGAGLENVIKQGLVAEGVSALQYYLVMRLKEPLIPHYIQALALGLKNLIVFNFPIFPWLQIIVQVFPPK